MTQGQDTWDALFQHLMEIKEQGTETASLKEKIQRLPDLIRELALYDDQIGNRDLVHYTSWIRTLSILQADLNQQERKNPLMRMYNYELANDPEEGEIIPEEWQEAEEQEGKWINEWLQKHDKYWWDEHSRGGSTYGCSFSSGQKGVEDDLTYWRLYGNNGEGCSLKISSSTSRVYRVRYRHKGKIDGTPEEKKVRRKWAELQKKNKRIIKLLNE